MKVTVWHGHGAFTRAPGWIIRWPECKDPDGKARTSQWGTRRLLRKLRREHGPLEIHYSRDDRYAERHGNPSCCQWIPDGVPDDVIMSGPGWYTVHHPKG